MRSKRPKQSPSPSGTLGDISEEAVAKLLRRANRSGKNIFENHLHSSDSIRKQDSGPQRDKNNVDSRVGLYTSESEGCSRDALRKVSKEERDNEEIFQRPLIDSRVELDDSDWEDGPVPVSKSLGSHEVTIELNATPDSKRRKRSRRVSVEDKELAELVHKGHLLCLIARGRLIDKACDDALIQAALLSLLPMHLLNIANVAKLTAKHLQPLVSWFQNKFRVRNTNARKSYHLALHFALETFEGTQEEIAALSVALFRALNMTARFVSILNVASLKPEVDKAECSSEVSSRSSKGAFSTSTPMVARMSNVSVSPAKPLPDTLSCEAQSDTSEACHAKNSQGLKRRGDVEFEMQLEMALSATAVPTADTRIGSANKDCDSNVAKRMKRTLYEESPMSSKNISTAVGSRKEGCPLYWAEVYCNGENLTGKWLHIDAINAIIDGEYNVEAVAATCKMPLRYVVAFAGNGVKDVTRRYCLKWYKIASQRVDPIWWDMVLAPLRDLEVRETGGMVCLEKEHSGLDVGPSLSSSEIATRNSLEDMELETRALTEPLPTNQQAYKNHHLYAIEKWLTKHQILHPKGPILGFCSGHPVYSRTCVQLLKTKHKWLREGLQVKPSERPLKELKRSTSLKKVQVPEDDDCAGGNSNGTIELYGKWQVEPLHLLHAVNGVVPKNEHGNVEVWSQKCLPPGTVHLRLPRVFSVAKRLDIDYAPAMVDFEFKNGQSYPVFDGIVVCAEFKDAILEAYTEEQDRREALEKKKNEMQVISRWYQLLSSIITRQRLKNRYGESSYEALVETQDLNSKLDAQLGGSQNDEKQQGSLHENRSDDPPTIMLENHEHVFLKENQSFDKDNLVVTKRCLCGLSVQVEEL